MRRWLFRRTATERLIDIEILLKEVHKQGATIMTKLDDMKAAIDALKTSDAALHDEIAVVVDLIKTLAASQPDPAVNEAVDAALAALAEAKAANEADKAALDAAVGGVSASGSPSNN